MTEDQIELIQKKIGTKPDGFWGPKSIKAAQKHLRKLMPSPNPWPSDLNAFYGIVGEEHSKERREFMKRIVNLNVSGLGVHYLDNLTPSKTIQCHEKVADSLLGIIKEISASEYAYVLREYGGCLNIRPMRKGKRPSVHSWGAAIDFMPTSNSYTANWPLEADMPFEVMEIFASRGAIPAGAFWGYDGMHFQFTK